MERLILTDWFRGRLVNLSAGTEWVREKTRSPIKGTSLFTRWTKEGMNSRHMIGAVSLRRVDLYARSSGTPYFIHRELILRRLMKKSSPFLFFLRSQADGLISPRSFKTGLFMLRRGQWTSESFFWLSEHTEYLKVGHWMGQAASFTLSREGSSLSLLAASFFSKDETSNVTETNRNAPPTSPVCCTYRSRNPDRYVTYASAKGRTG